MKKCIFVIGPEGSGSRVAAKICSNVLGIHQYGDWKGNDWSDKGHHKVCHFSLPNGRPPKFPDVGQWVSENEKNYEIYFVLTTRDITISELSRFNRRAKPFKQSQKESAKARDIMLMIINSRHKYIIWSYESFMFLREGYLNSLYEFIGVKSEFIPNLIDANIGKIVKVKKVNEIGTRLIRALTHSSLRWLVEIILFVILWLSVIIGTLFVIVYFDVSRDIVLTLFFSTFLMPLLVSRIWRDGRVNNKYKNICFTLNCGISLIILGILYMPIIHYHYNSFDGLISFAFGLPMFVVALALGLYLTCKIFIQIMKGETWQGRCRASLQRP